MAILPSLGLTVVQMHSHLPAAIPEQALHWWCPDPAAQSTLGDGPGACWTYLEALNETFFTTIELLSLKFLMIR